MDQLVRSRFAQAFIPTNLLIIWFGGLGILESIASSGMKIFGPSEEALTTKLDVVLVAIIFAGTLLYWIASSGEELKTKIIRSLLFAIATYLFSAIDIFVFLISYFLSINLLGGLHVLFLGPPTGGDLIGNFETKVAAAGLLAIICITGLFFYRQNSTNKDLRGNFLKSLLLLYALLLILGPLILPVLLFLPDLIY